MKTRSYALNFALILTTAVSTYFVTPLITNTADAQQAAAQAKADNEYQVGALLYMQKSAEYRALAYQAYNWARVTLDADDKTKKKLPKPERKKPRAVVVDIDETVLDNSPAQAQLIKDREPFSTTGNWYPWGEMRKAKAIPGAVEFLNYAISKGVKVFFISNRDEVQKQATMDNLKKAGFQGVTDETVLLRRDPKVSTKTPRREAISKDHRIVFLMGDNLDDFSDVFEIDSIARGAGENKISFVAKRLEITDANKMNFGTKFIVLPNAIYGTWESTIYRDAKDMPYANNRSLIRVNALELP